MAVCVIERTTGRSLFAEAGRNSMLAELCKLHFLTVEVQLGTNSELVLSRLWRDILRIM